MLLPLKDEEPTGVTPYVTFSLIGLNIFSFLTEFKITTEEQYSRILSMGVIPARFFEDLQTTDFFLPPWATLLTSMFLHNGGAHIVPNLLYLWIFGGKVEEYLGSKKFVIFYLLCGVAAIGAEVFSNPSSQVPLIGASGAISGVLGAYFILCPKNNIMCLVSLRLIPRIVPLPAWYVLGLWFVIQLILGVMSLSHPLGHVAWFAHIGGFVAGITLIYVLRGAPRERPMY